MVTITDFQPDLLVAEQGWWVKEGDGVTRFVRMEDRLRKGIKLSEGMGVDVVKEKVICDLKINVRHEKIELTYEKPEWMDTQGKVIPVPVHIQTDEDMEIFNKMRVDLHDLKLYVIPMPIHMTLVLDEYGVMMMTDGFWGGMRGTSLGWHGDAYQSGNFGSLSSAMKYQKSKCLAMRSSASSEGDTLSGSGSTYSERVLNLTKDLFQQFSDEGEVVPIGENNDSHRLEPALALDLPPFVFERDAAPVVDDEENTRNKRDYKRRGVGRLENLVLDEAYEGDDMFVGRVFKDGDDCKAKMSVHAIKRKFSYRNERSNGDFVISWCVDDLCPWRVYAARLDDSEHFQIRTSFLEHTCPIEVRSQFHKKASSSVISEILRNRYGNATQGPRPREVMRSMLDEHNVHVSYWKAWRGRELAIDSANGTASKSFSLLPGYLHLHRESNPGTVADLETVTDKEGNVRFKYCFVSLAASIRGLQFMRKVLVIDGAHLRGKYAGCLLNASAEDGNF